LDPDTIQRLVDTYDPNDPNRADIAQSYDGDKIQVDASLATLPVADSNFSRRTINALLRNGIVLLGDLQNYSFADLRENFTGMGLTSVQEVEAFLRNAAQAEYLELHDFLLKSIKQRHLEVFDSYYSLSNYSSKKTLEAVAQEYGVTRERIRQINKTVLEKVGRAIRAKLIKPDIELAIFDNINSPLQAMPELSPVYNKQAVVRVYVDTEALEIALYKNPRLNSEWVIDNDFNIESQVNRAVEALKAQIGPVKIDELAEEFSVTEKVLYDIRNTTISDGLIVLNTNKRATGNDLAFEIKDYMDKAVRPVTITEIANALNLTMNQTRGLIYRIPGVVNVGLSTYALSKYGYSGRSIIEIAAEFLAAEGEPAHIDRITSYVTKYRLVKDSSVPAQINASPEIFTRLDESFYALKEWGYEPTDSIQSTRLEVPAKDAVLDILSGSEVPMSPTDVLKAVIEKYGDRSTTKAVTVYSVLVNLHKHGKLTKLGTDRSPFYQMNR
jgi:DNA-directed RNA polymerase specialized sigma subunit